MKIFHCGHCDQLVFFENTSCINCGKTLAYLPDRTEMGTFDPDGDGWKLLNKGQESGSYRLCQNYSQEKVCNWAVPHDDPNPFCQSCRLTRVIPDLGRDGARAAWARLEMAKRRMIYSLIRMNLPLATKLEDPERGLAYEFLADADSGTPVLTGHDEGVIIINIAEADDAERERRRLQMHEPYRTILGHFRHEVGHYYWDRLIRDGAELEGFRHLFGDEREDYNQALQRHYKDGAPADWPSRFVSAYASTHPWEDWAESWAHYMHIVDTLETAVDCGLTLRPKRSDEPAMKPNIDVIGDRPATFDQIRDRWFPLTYVLNSLNRGMGLPDAYPFVLSTPALDKLRYVHEVVGRAG
jgi:hypothetical protein